MLEKWQEKTEEQQKHVVSDQQQLMKTFKSLHQGQVLACVRGHVIAYEVNRKMRLCRLSRGSRNHTDTCQQKLWIFFSQREDQSVMNLLYKPKETRGKGERLKWDGWVQSANFSVSTHWHTSADKQSEDPLPASLPLYSLQRTILSGSKETSPTFQLLNQLETPMFPWLQTTTAFIP